MAKREQPVAECTKCRSVSRRMEQINLRCSEQISGKLCKRGMTGLLAGLKAHVEKGLLPRGKG